jgi:hypothetical protein
MFEDKVKRILAHADRELRDVIAEAATVGDLAGVDAARMAVGGVREIVRGVHRRGVASGGRGAGSKATGRKRVRRAKKRGGRASAYPKFMVRNESLYRVGWSKKRREEYHHRVPRRVFDGTVEAMAGLSALGGGPFTAEQVIERANAAAREAYPTYQVYVVVGFLRARGCVEQLGREGYEIPADLSRRAASAWAGLVGASAADVGGGGSGGPGVAG